MVHSSLILTDCAVIKCHYHIVFGSEKFGFFQFDSNNAKLQQYSTPLNEITS